MRPPAAFLAALLLVAPTSASGQEPAIFKIATIAPTGSPWADSLMEFKKLVESRSQGRLKVKTFLGGALGDENEMVLAAKRGQIQAVGASTGALASQVPELSVLELPYLFENEEEADYILEHVIRTKCEELFKKRGLVLAFWSENGFRSFGTREGAIHTPADLKGKKMRSQEQPVHLVMWRAFGASPVPIPTTEALTALQQGVVDGFDQTPLYAFAASWHTVIKHFAVSRHIYQPAAIAYHRESFEKLPADLQEILLQSGNDIAPSLLKQIRAMNPVLLENLKSFKVEVNTLTTAEKEAFKVAAKKARDEYLKTKATAGERELYRMIEKGLAGFRKSKP
jgi:tripartite ATP-independent transporter DctP family solute receptor